MVNKFRMNTAKNIETKEAITRKLEIASSYAGELSIEILSLDKIELDPNNNRDMVLTLYDAINGIEPSDPQYDRKKEDWKSLESLANTIREDQLINPIFVYRFGNKCRLIAGERRTLASAIAGKKEIIARITSQRPMGTKLKVLQWIENNERQDLSLAERITTLEAIFTEYFKEKEQKYNIESVTSKVLSNLTGISVTQARRYLLILKAKPEIKKAIHDGSLENIKLIELICSVTNVEHQDKLLIAALDGQTFDSILELKKNLELNQLRKIERRQSPSVKITLGNVKPTVAKIIIDALTSSPGLNEIMVLKIKSLNENIEWNNKKSVQESFKSMIKLLSEETSYE